MAIYDGVVTLADDEIPVIVELDEERIRMSASGTEIGEWRTDECTIVHLADSMYAITAEEESLHFVPNQPSLFAAAVSGGEPLVTKPPSPEEEKASDGPREAPPPQPLTMGLFYALCLVTLAMAAWALVSILF
ncbi:MAG: hypothetical protein ACRDU9_03075 [Acidimicrobiia bacterium]